MGPVPSQHAAPFNWSEFVPYFQPLVTVRTGALVGFEVLARWNHPTRGLVTPTVFIPMAERDGWIAPLTNQILSQAFSAAAILPAPLTLSINISPVQLKDPRLPGSIEEAARQAGFSLDRLVVEITESALVHNLRKARTVANALNALGCRIALDDFGTGYSSLRHLENLPFNELKVDRSFIQSMAEKRQSRKIVAAIVGLGQSLGLTTVAEGVEHEKQAEMLSWLGCEQAQGWLYGKPLPAEELPAMLAARRTPASANPLAGDPLLSGLEALPSLRLAQLQAVFDGAPVGLAFLDRRFGLLNVNREFAELHGLSVQAILGRPMPDVLPGMFRQTRAALESALAGMPTDDLEVEETDAGGAIKTYLTTVHPVVDEAGEIVGLSCAVKDFTERKLNEQKLRQYECVVEQIEDMIAIVDRDYRYILANRAFLAFRGLSREDLIGKTVPEVVGSDLFEKELKRHLDKCLAGKNVYFESRLAGALHDTDNVTFLYEPIDMGGGIRAAACVLRKSVELRRPRHKETAWDTRLKFAERAGLRIGLWDWDIESDALKWSDTHCHQWGVTPKTFRGRLDEALARIHPGDRPKVEAQLRRVQSGETREFSAEYRVVQSDGTLTWMESQGVLMSHPSPHVFGVTLNMTDWKRTQGRHVLRTSFSRSHLRSLM